MKRFFSLSLLIASSLFLTSCNGSKVSLRGDSFSFDTQTPPAVILPAAGGPASSFTDEPRDGFTIVIPLLLSSFTKDTELLCIPGTVNVRLRLHNPKDVETQNYPAGKMPDGSCPVLESTLTLWSPSYEGSRNMTIGVPLGLLPNPWGKHELVLQFTGVAWEMYLDSRLVDRDFAFGYPKPAEEAAVARCDSRYVGESRIWTPFIQPQPKKQKQEYSQAQYFTPKGHNTWVGDVATIWYKGRYHVFYLLDRRGHRSKFGNGGHYFEHLSTADFKHWTEHQAATPIEEQWETFGTGVPFVWHDSLMISYGMHTSRLYPYQKTASPREWEHIKQFGCSEVIPFEALDSLIPSGCTFSVSRDGISNFEKSRIIIHPSENPTIYYDHDKRLCMLANYASRGTWTAEDLRGPWTCISEDFPPGGDCTFFFNWGGWEYIVGGFTNMWRKPLEAGIDAYEDLAAQGLDFYDGLCVPSICRIGDGRYLSAGWVRVNGHWGGPLVVRELIQYPDGVIGTRFMPEMMPLTRPARRLAEAVGAGDRFETGCRSFMLTFDVEPAADGNLSLHFGSGERSCQWNLDAAECRAQFSDDGSRQKSLREGGLPYNAWNYAIENIRGIDKPFEVRIIVKGEPKWGGSLIDVEIAGQRTMIDDRYGLSVDELVFDVQGFNVRNLRLAPLRNL
jgi:hypothetical protein